MASHNDKDNMEVFSISPKSASCVSQVDYGVPGGDSQHRLPSICIHVTAE